MTSTTPSTPLADVLDAATAEKLAGLDLTTVGQLLFYTPRRYAQAGVVASDELPEAGEWITIVGRITRADLIRMKRRNGQFLKVLVDDDSRIYEASFFNPRYIKNKLRPGARVMMAGKVGLYQGRVQLAHPEWAVLPDGADPDVAVVGNSMMQQLYAVEQEAREAETGEGVSLDEAFERAILPIYPATKDVQTWDIWAAVRRVLAQLGPVPDALTDEQRAQRELITTDEAWRRIHLPEKMTDVDAARERLRFDEAYAMQLVLAQRARLGRAETARPCPYVPGGLEDALRQRLPFTLTDGQETVLREIDDELDRDVPMSRLLQGEVGSGKTLVALLAMLRVVDNGQQCALLAPTEVLAAQHYRTIRGMLGDLGIGGQLGAADGATTITLVTGSQRTAEKKQALLDVVTGTAGIVIGTHALLQENVEFFDLGLVVVDEQHRFGVEQRDVLRTKAAGGRAPHHLVMTATPIPRTVAMTVFGDLETSVLTELPKGRQEISSSVVPMGKPAWMNRVWERAGEEVASGRQVYVVCSRIGDETSEKKAAKNDDGRREPVSLLDLYDEVGARLPDCRIGMLHGRMPADDKAAVMDEFTAGEIDVLVSTTVIEVGVDVPNATVMIIVDADRFGVSQLHQLRGRVGRGGLPGLCLLVTAVPEGSAPFRRLAAVAGTVDGFELARLDLAERREGDVLGELQSGGASSLRFLSLLDDAEVIADARELAQSVVDGGLTLGGHPGAATIIDAVVGSRADFLDKS
ncbi:ATP-dependent DNA helicase RecG [Gordonia sp. X0973]|uniref:ATP-dependent DNA helicase RecG n=1 Tax=Gordonia sp. X0973 TaxID=2742602 RepID=UPI000F53AEB4|nr:ATP-dependent DNA helicase RecG [Gordonia sp. X0973]QKT07763.1 ATP-dependent DNA helicase RecG [Gordonia sp. X0973]